MNTRAKATETALFLALAFGLPWLGVLVLRLVPALDGAPFLLLYGAMAAAPAIAAMVCLLCFEGRVRVVARLRCWYAPRARPGAVAAALVLPACTFLLAALFCRLLLGISVFHTGAGVGQVLIALWALVSEEAGWRGFLTERLEGTLGRLGTPLAVGLLWALWHAPFFALGTLAAPVAAFALGCVADSYALYWLTRRARGNLIPASAWHAAGNVLFCFFWLYPKQNGGSALPYLLYALCAVLTATGVTLYIHTKENAKDGRGMLCR